MEIKLLYARTATEGQYGSTWDGEEKEKSRVEKEVSLKATATRML